MLSALGNIVFLQPALLAALLALPILWYILRVTPPAPKTLYFPAIHFLYGLVSDKKTPSKSPWWILLLRLLMAALIITALARPVINPAEKLSGNGDLRVILDNSWAGAQNWSTQISAAEEAIKQAERENRNVYILPTTYNDIDKTAWQNRPYSASEALSVLRGLTPNPWPADYKELSEFLISLPRQEIQTLWTGHGLDEGDALSLFEILARQGDVRYMMPSPENLPLLLRPAKTTKKEKEIIEGFSNLSIAVDAPQEIAQGSPVTIQIANTDGNIIDALNQNISSENLPASFDFSLSDALYKNVARFLISGKSGAGTIFILDDNHKKRTVGIATSSQEDSTSPLIENTYYIKRALEPFANIETGLITELLDKKPSAIILPDIANIPTQTLNDLEKWVKDGGLLLRFAGPNMSGAQSDPFLLPVALRSGDRSLNGSLSWEKVQKIASFDKNSPFYGLSIPDDVSVRQQVLADPSQELDGKVWSSLEDGTPFITADILEKGRIVLIHTTANADWSDFALSGLYVDILKRILQMAGSSGNTSEIPNFTTLDPLLVMDGFGALTSPSPHVKPLNMNKSEQFIPDFEHPPGIYGRGNVQYALNLGSSLPPLYSMKNIPNSINVIPYNKSVEQDLMPYFLYAAFVLFCLDWIVMIMLSGLRLPKFRLAKQVSTIFLLGLILCPEKAYSQDLENADIKYANGFYLAYIETGDSAVDSITRRGLETLKEVLSQRTSIEPEGIAGLNPENDTLAFFPIIYWVVTPSQKSYSAKAFENIQSYLDQGGTILFDTRDQTKSASTPNNSAPAVALRRITSSLNIPPIIPIPENHVLGRAFYLLKDYPGRYTSGTLWVEESSKSGRDNVSSVLIGSNDWVGSWADSSGGNARGFTYGSGYKAKQNEMSLRFGVNLVMYAMTGNYKADQVHIPHILERLDQ